MTIHRFLTSLLLVILALSACVLATVWYSFDRSEQLHEIKWATAELVQVSLHGSSLLLDSEVEPIRVRLQWSALRERVALATTTLAAHGQAALARHVNELFSESDELLLDYLATIRQSPLPTARREWLKQSVRSRLAIIAAETESAQHAAFGQTRATRIQLSQLLLWMATAIPIVVLILLLLVQRRILPKVQAVLQAATAISAGDFHQPLTVKGRDEISQVAKAIDHMRLALALNLAQLERKNQQLAAKNEEVEAFVYAVSHDLRAPLVNLVGFAHELELSLASSAAQRPEAHDELVEELRTSTSFISKNAKRLEALIDALLRLSRTGRQDLEPEAIDLQSLVINICEDWRDRLQYVEAEYAIDSELGHAYLDPMAASRVLENLLSNAIKYRHPERDLRLRFSAETRDGRIILRMQDNGLGFPAAARDRLFLAFQRYHPDVAEGEGMGLAIVRRLLERSDASIAIETTAGGGATLILDLPAYHDRGKASE